MSATVADIREAKKQLEKDINDLVFNFYHNYKQDMVIHSVDVDISGEDFDTSVNVRVNI